MRIDSNPSSCDEEKCSHIDNKEGDCVKVDVESFKQDAEAAGEDPEERQSKSMILEEFLVVYEGS